MRAILIENFGAVESLKARELPTPTPGDGEVLVEIHAAAINPSDVKNVMGKMHGTTLPRIPGRDFAGVIVQGAREYVGREVWGTGGDLGFTREGSHAQYMLLPVTAVLTRPAALSFEEAGSAGVTFLTAWLAIVEAAKLVRGETALIIGASGGVGSAAVQIAISQGARVIGAIRKDEEAQAVRELGAEHTINSKAEDLSQAIRRLTDGRGADVVFDSSGMMFAEAIESTAAGARVPVISAPVDGKVNFNLRSLYRKQLIVRGVDSRGLDATACAAILNQMKPMFDSGQFKVKSSERFPLERAAEAYEQASRGARVVLVPG